jgi:putative sugar O-methyltransferase
MYILIFLYLMIVSLNVSNATVKTSASDNGQYPELCMQAAHDPELFAHFKRHPIYNSILEHVTEAQGVSYLTVALQQTPHYLNLLDHFRQNDLLGNPQIFNFGHFGNFSPTTLRYVKVTSDLEHLFGDLTQWDIIEIGGGYGGQCKIITDLFKYKSYTIVDLSGPLALTKKYLSDLGIDNVTFLTEEELPSGKTYDLIISNYAFSECVRPTQQVYLNKALIPSKRGYLTCNNGEFFNKRELMNQLEIHHLNVQELPEIPLTGERNYLLVWK